jgi:hypothetical protein
MITQHVTARAPIRLHFWKSSMSYTAPVKDTQSGIGKLAHLDRVSALPGFDDVTADTAQAVLEEAAKFSPNYADM